jgi:sugar phosphate isomerase/epimerase
MAELNRRQLLAGLATSAATASMLSGSVSAIAARPSPAPKRKPNRIAVSTYSYWRFRKDTKLSIEECVDLAAEAGFDGVEILQIQMRSEDNAALQRIKRRAFLNGLDLCGFSTHQGFVYPDKAQRQKNIDKTINSIELAYKLGIPTMRVNTGRWGTTKSFDALMANKGI